MYSIRGEISSDKLHFLVAGVTAGRSHKMNLSVKVNKCIKTSLKDFLLRAIA